MLPDHLQMMPKVKNMFFKNSVQDGNRERVTKEIKSRLEPEVRSWACRHFMENISYNSQSLKATNTVTEAGGNTG